jgi:hypothetical protein
MQALFMPGGRRLRGVVIVVVSALLVVAGFFGVEVHRLSQEQKSIKKDFSIINNVTYGILSVNRWRDLVVRSVNDQILHFQLSPSEKDSLQREIEVLLNALIDKADSIMQRPQKSLGGKIRKLAFHLFVKPSDLHKEAPVFAHKIMAEVMRPRSKERLAYLAKSKLQELGSETYDSTRNVQQARFDSLYRKYRVDNFDAFNKMAAARLTVIKRRMYAGAGVMVGCLLLLLLVWYLVRKQRSLFTLLYILSIGMAFILLLTGLTSVMIEIDARIDELSFHLAGQTISFKDQVIFFQSKSIVDVVVLLMRTGKFDSILVGVLILCFSIFFPISKLFCTGVYLIGEKSWTKRPVVSYFAFHSGKWSMADVMVVAIFMAYIGFNGIMNDQMADLNTQSSSFSSIATNRTSLQPGYIVFVAFVLFGLVLSQVLQKMEPRKGQ